MRRRNPRGVQKAPEEAVSEFDDFQMVGNPAAHAEQILKCGGTYATEAHYRARKNGGPLLSAALHLGERLRYIWGAAAGGLSLMAALYWYQVFFKANATGDAAENQGYYDLILFAIGSAVTSLAGDALHTKIGHQRYHDPRHFKEYFESLVAELTPEHPDFEAWTNPDPDNEEQCQQFYEFHLHVYQYLLSKDPRAAAYMLTSVTRDFPYFKWHQTVNVGEAADDTAAAAAESDESQRNRAIRAIYKQRLGLCQDASDDALNTKLRAIMQKARDILAEDPQEASQTVLHFQDKPNLAQLRQAPVVGARIRAMQERLLAARTTMADGDARRLAALNKALQQENCSLILDPVSAAVFFDMEAPPIVGAGDGESEEALGDRLNLPLLHGGQARLFFSEDGVLKHGVFDIEGFLNRDVRSKSELPEKNDPTYRQDFNVGGFGVLLAQETYRQIHGGGKLKTDAQRVAELATLLRRFVGHVNPLTLQRPGYDLETQLCDRAHVLAHLLQEGGHYDHWQHWIAHSEIRTRAFLQLTVEQQVWLIFELLSGADYAKLVALSILQDPLFLGAEFSTYQRGLSGDMPYNRFMREYIAFMQRHVNDPSQSEIGNETRKMLFSEQLVLLTDVSTDHGWAVSSFLNRHTRKSNIILTALLEALSPDKAAVYLKEISNYLDGSDESNRLDRLVSLENTLLKKLGGASFNRDITDLMYRNEAVDLNAIGERVSIRNDLFYVRWLISYYRARRHVGKLLSVITISPDKRALMIELVRNKPECIALVFPLDDSNLDLQALQEVFLKLDYTAVSDELRDYIWQVLKRIMNEEHPFEKDGTTLRDDYREPLHFCARLIIKLCRGNAIDDSTQMLDQCRSIFHEETADRDMGFLMAAMLEECVKEPDPDFQNTVFFNQMMVGYYHHMQRVIPERYWNEINQPPNRWLQELFFTYLRRFRVEMRDAIHTDSRGQETAITAGAAEIIISAFTKGASTSEQHKQYWGYFRVALATLHFPWDCWHGNTVLEPALKQWLELSSRGFAAGNDQKLIDTGKHQQAITDAWNMVYLCLQIEEHVADERRESFPHLINAQSMGALQNVLAQLYAYQQRSPEDWAIADHLPEDCRTRQALTARLVHALLSPTQLSRGRFDDFAMQLMPQIMQALRGVNGEAANDHALLTGLINALPEALRTDDVVKQRLVLAYAYWCWGRVHNTSGLSRVSLYVRCKAGQADVEAGRAAQSIMHVLDPDQTRTDLLDTVFTDGFLLQLHVPLKGRFHCWLRHQLAADRVLAGDSVVVNIGDDEPTETTYLLT